MAEKPDTTNPSAQPAAEGHKPETYAAGFLRLMALRQAVEKTLAEMAVLLDVDTPEPIAIPVRASVCGHQRREA